MPHAFGAGSSQSSLLKKVLLMCACVCVHCRASTNPFNIPADEDIFRHREEDKLRKTEMRLAALQQSVAAKSTFASRMQATTTSEAKELIREFRPPKPKKEEKTLAATATTAPERRKEKENMTDFIAKKREIFLLQVRRKGWGS